jgi:hypothetical protein
MLVNLSSYCSQARDHVYDAVARISKNELQANVASDILDGATAE